MAAEEALIGRKLGRARGKVEGFGLLRGEEVEVFADDAVMLHVEVDEPPTDEAADLTVVFIHGYALNQDCWHYQRRDLAGLARLAFMDQRAHGRSHRGSPEMTSARQLGRDLRSVIDVISPTGPLILVGHSMGGMNILSLAAEDAEFFRARVAGVALLATTSTGLKREDLGLPPRMGAAVRRTLPRMLDLATQQQKLAELGRGGASDLAFILTKRYSFGSHVPAHFTEFVSDMLNGTSIDVIAEYFATVAGFEAAEAVAQLADIDTLVMVGDADLVTPPRHSHEIVERAAHAELVILPRTGHMLLLERWAEVNDHLIRLINRVRVRLAERERLLEP